jgi:uncharacterized protein YegL
MRTDLTDITIVLDRSGSMGSCRKSAEDGLNEFVSKQKQQPGKANFTLVMFDDQYEVPFRAVPIGEVPTCELKPRGMTALHDAIGKAITETGERLRQTSENDRPGLVIFVVITDGGENSSREFSGAKIAEMIKHQETKYNWQFTYLGANQDAIATGGGLGFSPDKTADYKTNQKNMRGTYNTLSAKVSGARGMSMAGLPVEDALSYNATDRAAMTEE